MKLTPSSTASRRTARAPSRSGGSPHTPHPVILIAPNPIRWTGVSPPSSYRCRGHLQVWPHPRESVPARGGCQRRSSGVPDHRLARRDVPRHDRPCADQGAFADPDPTEEDGARPDRGAALDGRPQQGPVGVGLKFARDRSSRGEICR